MVVLRDGELVVEDEFHLKRSIDESRWGEAWGLKDPCNR